MRINNVCVLGGTGFVGRHLVHHLAVGGRRVRVLTSHRERNKDMLVLPTVELVDAHVHDPEQLTEYLRGCDAVINLVGVLHDHRGGGRGFRDVHVELVTRLIRACQNAGVKRLLHMSALRANTASAPSYYLRSKGEGEDRVLDAAKQGLQAMAFRPSVIFGPGDHFINRFAGLLRRSPGLMPLPCPDSRYAPVYVGDLVRVFEEALERPDAAGRVYELCGPKEYTLRQLVGLIADELDLRRRILGLGSGLSRAAALAMEFVPGKPLTVDNYLSMQLPNICGQDHYEDGFQVFGMEATPLEGVIHHVLQPHSARAEYQRFRERARRD